MRTIASQMKDAEGQSITVRIDATPRRAQGGTVEACTFVASGRTITFHGFLKAYVEAVDEADGAVRRRPDPAAAADPRASRCGPSR